MSQKKHARQSKTDLLLEQVRSGGREMTWREQIELTARLSLPAILAQMAHILMEYIDASMVGRLGAVDSASIGLVATTTWLFWGVTSAVATGFSVQVAHRIGARDAAGARNVLRQAFVVCITMGLIISLVGVSISRPLPYWLGGDATIAVGATKYFFIFAITIPFFILAFLMSSMLRCSGNIKIPSILNVLMCFLDVLFNFLLIFPTREVSLLGMNVTIWGGGLGIVGAALGTTFAEMVTACLLFYFLCYRSLHLRILGKRKFEESKWSMFKPTERVLKKAFKIGLPIGCVH